MTVGQKISIFLLLAAFTVIFIAIGHATSVLSQPAPVLDMEGYKSVDTEVRSGTGEVVSRHNASLVNLKSATGGRAETEPKRKTSTIGPAGKEFEEAKNRLASELGSGITRQHVVYIPENLERIPEIERTIDRADLFYMQYIREFERKALGTSHSYLKETSPDFIRKKAFVSIGNELRSRAIRYIILESTYFKHAKQEVYDSKYLELSGSLGNRQEFRRKLIKDIESTLKNKYESAVDEWIEYWVRGWKTGKYKTEEELEWHRVINDLVTRLEGIEESESLEISDLEKPEKPAPDTSGWIEKEREKTDHFTR